jgi:hypothetical protein
MSVITRPIEKRTENTNPTLRPPQSSIRASKSITLVFEAADLLISKAVLSDMIAAEFLSPGIKISDLSSIFREPRQNIDVLIIMNPGPATLMGSFASFRQALDEFKKANPRSAVLIVKAFGPTSLPGMRLDQLVRENLVDHLEQGPISFNQVIARGSGIFDKKQEF